MSIKYSEIFLADEVLSAGDNDIIVLAIVDGGAPTGYTTKAIKKSNLLDFLPLAGGTMVGNIEIGSLQRIKRKPTENINSYEWLVKGNYHHVRTGKDNNLKAIDMLKGVQSIKDKAKNNPHNKRALAFVSGLTDRKLKLREIAELLNSNGFKTSTGKDFGTTQVIRLLQKIDS